MQQNRFTTLTGRYLSGGISMEELEELQLLVAAVDDEQLQHWLFSVWEEYAPSEDMPAGKAGAMLNGILGRPARRVPFLRRWWWAAASVILVLGAGAYLRTMHERDTQPPAVAAARTDIAPGKEGAILTLSDGRQVVLDSLANGVIAMQNGAEVLLQDGNLAYDVAGPATAGVMYNTMTTPKGRQFRMVLPDGTKVWLNAASSITYPTVFTGKERPVKITGEAYLEVTKNAAMPFRVNVNDKASIEVLGTHFNVNAYDNEASIHTTLLEGSIRASVLSSGRPAQKEEALLQPGQQAFISRGAGSSSRIRVQPADVEKVLAWKSGLFNFEGATLEEAMKQIERWYDIEVVYEKEIPSIELGGEITKGVSLNGLLVLLKRADVRFRLEGRRLIVLP